MEIGMAITTRKLPGIVKFSPLKYFYPPQRRYRVGVSWCNQNKILLSQRRADRVPVDSIKRKEPLRPFFAIMRSHQRMLYPAAHRTACNRSPSSPYK